MIEDLERVANEIANSRVRLAHPILGEQSREDVLEEVKRLEHIEVYLRKCISVLDDKNTELKKLLD